MSALKRWIDRLFNLKTAVEHEVELAVRTDVAVAGAVIRAQAAAEARAYADEIKGANPELAAAILAALDCQTTTPQIVVGAPAVAGTAPPQLPAAPGKRSPGRPRKVAQLPPPDTQPDRSQP